MAAADDFALVIVLLRVNVVQVDGEGFRVDVAALLLLVAPVVNLDPLGRQDHVPAAAVLLDQALDQAVPEVVPLDEGHLVVVEVVVDHDVVRVGARLVEGLDLPLGGQFGLHWSDN